MQVPCPYILSRFLHVMLCHTSKFRTIWYNLIYRDTPPEIDRVYRNIAQSLGNYSNLSTVGFELQTYCMVVWQPNYYNKITRPLQPMLYYLYEIVLRLLFFWFLKYFY